MGRNKKNKKLKTTSATPPATEPAKSSNEASNATNSASSPSSSSSSPAPSLSSSSSSSSSTNGVKPAKAKLAAKRAKVLSYEAALAPKPNPIKPPQPRPAQSESAAEQAERVRAMAVRMKKAQSPKEIEKQRRLEEAARNRPLTSTEHLRGSKKTAFDLWDAPPSQAAVEELVKEKKVGLEWVDPAIPKPVKPPKGLHERQHPTKVPAVEVPAPGNSYRPAYDDHQDVLGEILAKRLIRREEKKKLERVVRPIQRGLKRKRDNTHEYLAGLEDILGIEKKVADVKEEQEDQENGSRRRRLPNASTRWSVKLSKTERNKLKKRELRRKTKKYKRLVKKRRMELEALPEIVQTIEEEEADHQTYLERKEMEREEKEGKPKQLSRYPFARQPTPYLLSDEIPQSLRQFSMPRKYNPFKERFISLQKRNLIEARVPVARRRRYRIKYYEPKSAKMDWELPQ